MKINCRIIFPVGGKGGVGKSWAVGLVALLLELLKVVYVLVDADDETSTTSRFFPHARFLVIRSSTEIDQLIELATTGEYKVILVDLPARSGEEFQAWFGLVPWAELAELGIRFTALAVISGSKDSLECILRWREFLGDHVDYALVLNRRDSLRIYETSKARQVFAAAGYPEIELLKLDEKLTSELDRMSWTISRALDSTEPNLLTQIMARSRLRRYRDQVFAELNKIITLLVP